MKGLLTESEVATSEAKPGILPVTKWTLRAWRRKGIGPRWIRVGGKKIAYPSRDLEIYLRTCPAGGGVPTPKEAG